MPIARFVVRVMVVSMAICVAMVVVARVMGQTRRNSELAFIEMQTYGEAIFLVDVEMDRYLFIASGGVGCALSWSPDGHQMVFSYGDPEMLPELYIITAFSRRRETPVLQMTEELSPSWSPDGQTILFLARQEGSWQLLLMHPDGSHLEVLGRNPHIYPQRIVWFADSQRFLIAGYVFDIRNRESIEYAAGVVYPNLSPDNRQIVYHALRDGNTDIYLYDLDSQQETRLTDSFERDILPVWSPDGSQIAFISRREGVDTLWLMDRQGSNQRALFEAPFTDMGELVWSPDGTRIAFSARDTSPDYLGYVETNMEYNMYLINADGSHLRQIFEGYSDYEFTFSQFCGLTWRP